MQCWEGDKGGAVGGKKGPTELTKLYTASAVARSTLMASRVNPLATALTDILYEGVLPCPVCSLLGWIFLVVD